MQIFWQEGSPKMKEEEVSHHRGNELETAQTEGHRRHCMVKGQETRDEDGQAGKMCKGGGHGEGFPFILIAIKDMEDFKNIISLIKILNY